MKKILPLLLLIVVAVGAWYFSSSAKPSADNQAAQNSTQPHDQQSQHSTSDALHSTGPAVNASTESEDSGTADEEIRPATEKYKNADEALAAVKNGANDYDDLVLEQFTQPGEDCSWCPQFYQSVRDLLLAEGTKADQRSYYAEIMAVSGRPENLATLIEAAKGAPTPEERDIYAEALELAVGGDTVVKYLGDHMVTDNQVVKEAVIAAITNQGTRLAAETLYKQTVEAGDPDGYYSLGIGLGELVPDPEAVPYLQELMLKRDPYSHLALKSLLNSGLGGVQVVFDVLTNSKDPEFDRKMLKDAVDHVNYEEDIEGYVKKVYETSSQPLLKEFAKSILDDFKANEEADQETGEETDAAN